MNEQTWTVVLTERAQREFRSITDTRIRSGIDKVINRLIHEPEKQGKPLSGDLAGLRTIRAVGQRYRILYQVRATEIVVLVVALGIRREGSRTDVYAQAERDAIAGKLDTALPLDVKQKNQDEV